MGSLGCTSQAGAARGHRTVLLPRGHRHTSALFARGSSCLQPVLETLSCLACLQVAGQDAEARCPGLEWPGRMLEAICDPQLGAEMLLVLEASDPSESVPAVLSSGHQYVPGDRN